VSFKLPIARKTEKGATGPLAGSPYDFRTLFPAVQGPVAPVPAARVSPVAQVSPAQVPGVAGAPPAAAQSKSTTRRALFEMFRGGKAKP